MVKPPLIVICGPTGSGKTKMAISMAKEIGGEIINADSRQVYSEIPIASMIPTIDERDGIPHHIFGIRKISEPLNVAEYKIMSEKTIDEIHSRNKIPILCGGSNLWIDAVVENFQMPPGNPDHSFRKVMEGLALEDLLSRLKQVDKISFEKFQKEKNRRYIIRALEIAMVSGKPKSSLARKGERKYEVKKIAPDLPREVLYEGLNKRTEDQLTAGLVEEIQALVEQYAGGIPQKLLELGYPAITGIGCKEVIPYLLGKISKEKLLETLQQHNRNFAKRQLTWLRRDTEIDWRK